MKYQRDLIHSCAQDSFKLQINDAILVQVDETDVIRDAKLGYHLPLSLGIVEKVDVNQRKVLVCWMYGERWTSSWIKWVCPKTKKVSKDWIDEDSIVTINNEFVTVNLVKDPKRVGYYTLDDKSISTIIKITE